MTVHRIFVRMRGLDAGSGVGEESVDSFPD
jgi:hypothetical protein